MMPLQSGRVAVRHDDSRASAPVKGSPQRSIEVTQSDDLCQLITGVSRDQLLRTQHDVAPLRDPIGLVASNLPDAVRTSLRQQNGLDGALAPLISQGVLHAVAHDAQAFGKALAPAMGPAIRESVVQAIQNAVSSLEQAIEHSLSPTSLRWRLEAVRTGKSFAEILMLKTLAYRVEHIFLIHAQTGLPLCHLSCEGVTQRDPDLISSLMTAIRSFAEEAFDAAPGAQLDGLSVGDLNLWVNRGSNVVLALAIRGIAPGELRNHAQVAVEQIELRHLPQIQSFEGEEGAFEPARPLLEPLLMSQRREPQTSGSRRKRWIWAGLGLTAMALVIGGIYSSWREAERWETAIARLDSEPGIVVTQVEAVGNKRRISGLRDPLASEPEGVLKGAGIEVTRVALRLRPYFAAEESIVLQRARRVLAVPPSVQTSLRDGVLVAVGEAPQSWHKRAALVGTTISGIASVDLAGVRNTDLQKYRILVQSLNGQAIYFELGSAVLSGTAAQQLATIGRQLAEVAQQARVLGRSPPSVELNAITGPPGNPLRDAQLADERLKAVQRALSRSADGVAVRRSGGAAKKTPCPHSAATQAALPCVRVRLLCTAG